MNTNSPRATMAAAQRQLAYALEQKAYFAAQRHTLHTAMTHIESMRYWLKTASDMKTLKARKAHLMASANNAMAEGRAEAHQAIEYVTERTGGKLRMAISWYETAKVCSTFAQWDEVVAAFERYACDVLVMLDVSLVSAKVKWTSAKMEAIRCRQIIAKANKASLPPVAVNMVAKKLAIAQHYAAWTDYKTREYIYWQPLQTADHPFRMWVLAVNMEYSSMRSGIRA